MAWHGMHGTGRGKRHTTQATPRKQTSRKQTSRKQHHVSERHVSKRHATKRHTTNISQPSYPKQTNNTTRKHNKTNQLMNLFIDRPHTNIQKETVVVEGV
jgi:hypothetical protein